jgi:YD repeat-containing protein
MRQLPLRYLQGLLATAFVLNSLSSFADPVYDARGFTPHRTFASELPFEHIDPFTGNLLLTFTDLLLPGNAGFDLRIQRTYNSKIYKDYNLQAGLLDEDSWAGVGWTMHFGRVLQPNETNQNPIIEMPDGSRHPTFHHIAPPQGCGACFITKEFWIYDRDTKILKLPNGITLTFNHSGSIFNLGFALYATQIADTFGNSVAIAYDTTGGPADQITSVTQDLGNGQSRQVTFETQNGALATMTFLGRTWTYSQLSVAQGTYTAYSLLTSAQPPVGPAWTFGYEMTATPRYELKSVTTPNGGQIGYSYIEIDRYPGVGDPVHVRAVSQRTVGGRDIPQGTWSYSYISRDNTTITGPCSSTTYTFIGPVPGYPFAWQFGLQSSVSVGSGAETETLQWIPSSFPISNDPQTVAGMTDSATYVALLSSRAVWRGLTYWTTYAYSYSNFNDYGRPQAISESGPAGTRNTTRTFQYGFSGYVIDKIAGETVTVANESFTKSYSFNTSNGFLMSQSVYSVTTTFTPDSRGNVSTSTDARGKQTTFTYQWGEVKDTQTPEGFSISRTINADGTTDSETRRGFTTTFSYDALGRVVWKRPPTGFGNQTTTNYDNVYGAFIQVTRGGSNVTTYLDGFGRTSGTLNGVGIRTSFRFDACGNRIFESYPFDTTETGTTIVYDTLSRVTRKQHPDLISAFRYYPNNDVVLRDELDHFTTQTWKAFGNPDEGRLASLNDAEGITTDYEYNALGSIKSVSNWYVNSRSWSYNSKNQLVSETHPENGQVTYERDAVGNMTKRTDAKNQQTLYTYDNNNRLKTIDAPGSLYDTQITYDESDNRRSVTNGFVSTMYTYDGANRVTGRTDTVNGRTFVTTITYDGNDNVASILYPSGRTVTYTYDTENRPLSVAEGSTFYARNFGYHPSGAISGFVAGNNQGHAMQFDSRHRVSSVTAGNELSLQYSYDFAGNVQWITDSRGGFNQSFTYDRLDRLRTANGMWGTGDFQYDAVGNRRSKSIGGATTNYSYDQSNHLTSASGTEPGSFVYDLNGNMTQDPAGIYTYSPDDMMETAIVGNWTTTYRYDGDRLRTFKEGQGGKTYYVHGPRGTLLAEYRELCPGQVQLVRDYIYAGERLIASVKPALQEPRVEVFSTVGTLTEANTSMFLSVRMTTSDGQPSGCLVSVNYATSDGTAAAGSDYTAASGVLNFAAGSNSGAMQQVVVPILDDSLDEDDETFRLTLSSPYGAILGQAVETVIILDNDPPPSLSIAAASTPEGNAGTATAVFTVSLSAASGRTVSVNYSTADGTATSADYISTSGTLTFPPGTITQTIPVAVNGDVVAEPDETFVVNLSSAVNASIATGQGLGTIVNDDCFVTTSPQSASVAGHGGMRSVSFTSSPAGCTWVASTNDSWFSITSSVSGTGDGLVNYSVAPNPTPPVRTGTISISGYSFSVHQTAGATLGDFDGDGSADPTVFRSSTGTWYSLRSSSNYTNTIVQPFGLSSDITVPGDYDGDGSADPTVFRPSTGTWYSLTSSSNYTYSIVQPFGLSSDVAVPGDYDGDGSADPTVFRPSTATWYILKSSTNYTTAIVQPFGLSTDITVPGDYDGDGKTDPGVFRPSTATWYVLLSSSNYTTAMVQPFGLSTDITVPGDYDGDGKSDLGVFRPSTATWYVLLSSTNYTAATVTPFGLSTDIIVPGDYDGDGKTDLGVFRPSTATWYVLRSSSNYTTAIVQPFGLSTDTPILRRP